MSTHSAPEALRVDGLAVAFGALRAVDGASLAVSAGEILALLGPSGCGKTTLLRCVAGFERAVEGTVTLGGDVVESAQRHVPAHRRGVGLVFQDYALFPHRTVAANVSYGLGRGPGRDARVAELLQMGGLQGLEKRYPHQLSGGQQQRVAVLRSLAPRPKVLLLDEPFSNLDPALRGDLRGEVARLVRAEGVSTVLVTHDRTDALSIADRVAVMERGRILEVAAPADLYYRPGSQAAARYGGEVQYVAGVAAGDTVETPLGRLANAGPVREGPCQVLVRPEWIIPCRGGALARLDTPRLEGQVLRQAVRLPGGLTLELTTTPGNAFPVGEEVAIGVHLATPAFPLS